MYQLNACNNCNTICVYIVNFLCGSTIRFYDSRSRCTFLCSWMRRSRFKDSCETPLTILCQLWVVAAVLKLCSRFTAIGFIDIFSCAICIESSRVGFIGSDGEAEMLDKIDDDAIGSSENLFSVVASRIPPNCEASLDEQFPIDELSLSMACWRSTSHRTINLPIKQHETLHARKLAVSGTKIALSSRYNHVLRGAKLELYPITLRIFRN